MARRFTRKILRHLLAPAAALWLAVLPASAHHGGTYHDMSRVITLHGTVAAFNFVNPHVLIHVDVKDDKGNTRRWIVEFNSPKVVLQQGWSRDMMKPGDEIVADVHPAKNGSPSARSRGQMLVNGRTVGALRP